METTNEKQWVQIGEGKHRIYFLSNDGELKFQFKSTGEFRPLKSWPYSGGYMCITLNDKAGQTFHTVHSLVMKHFGPPKPMEKGYEINHIDSDKQNNHISNLEWITISENRKNRKKWTHLKPYEIQFMQRNADVHNIQLMSELFHTSIATVYSIIKGKRHTQHAIA